MAVEEGSESGSVTSEAFPRTRRLTTKAEYERVFATKDLSVGAHPFTIFAASRPEGARLGLVIGKRALRRAVDRNLVKRSLREWFRRHGHELPPMDYVVLLRAAPKTLTAQAVGVQVAAAWTAVAKKAAQPRQSDQPRRRSRRSRARDKDSS